MTAMQESNLFNNWYDYRQIWRTQSPVTNFKIKTKTKCFNNNQIKTKQLSLFLNELYKKPKNGHGNDMYTVLYIVQIQARCASYLG